MMSKKRILQYRQFPTTVEKLNVDTKSTLDLTFPMFPDHVLLSGPMLLCTDKAPRFQTEFSTCFEEFLNIR